MCVWTCCVLLNLQTETEQRNSVSLPYPLYLFSSRNMLSSPRTYSATSDNLNYRFCCFVFLNSQSWNICHTRSPYSYLTVCLFWLSVWFKLHGIKNSIKHFIEYYSFPGIYNLYFYINYIYNFSKYHNIPNIFYKASKKNCTSKWGLVIATAD